MRKLKLEELGRVDVDTFKTQAKVHITLILDNIRSGMNVGSLFRTSDAYAIEQVILCGITAQPPHREILKTAIGATESVEWHYQEHIDTTLQALIAEDYHIIGIEQTDQSTHLQSYIVDPEVKYVLILGNEVRGISDSALPHLHESIEIAQYGTKHSLNVAVCGGIVIHHFATRMRGNS